MTKHGKHYQEAAKAIDSEKTYSPSEALELANKEDLVLGTGSLTVAAEVIEDRAVEVPEPDATAPDNTEGTPLEVESTAPPIADETAD